MRHIGPPLPMRKLTSVGLGWPGVAVVRFVGYEEVSQPPRPKHHAVIHLNDRSLNLTQRLDGSLRRERVRRGDVTIVPEGRAWEWGFTGEAGSDLLPLALDDDFLREAARGIDVDPDAFEIFPFLGGRDPEIERIALSLENEAEGLLGGKLYVESLATDLAIHLIREHSSLGRAAARGVERNGRLSGRALGNAVDFIGDNLGDDLRLAGISGAAHMSPFHFSRLFKKTTGFTPHEYVIERRVRRARELLRATTLPIAEISLRCGFSSQSHMNRHFTRLLGITPGAFR